jgi:hypothetical protein
MTVIPSKRQAEARLEGNSGNDILMTLGPIRTPFGFHSTAKDVIRGIDLSGRRVIITGASSGIGIETAEALAEARAEITLAVRNPHAGEEVAARLRISTGNPEIHVRRLDLADLHSVRAFASAWNGPLHILVNNAGIMANPEGYQNHLSWRPVESTVSSVRFPTPSPSVFKGAALGYI